MTDDLIFMVVFAVAILFQAFFVIYRAERVLNIVFGLITALAWLICGPVFILVEQTHPEISLLFTALGIVNVLFVLLAFFQDLADVMYVRKRRRGDLFQTT